MTITDFVSDTYLRATGKATTPPTSKYNQIIALGDFYQRRWARETGVDWASLYEPAVSFGTVTATDSYDIDTSSVRKLSDRQGDYVRILWTDGVGYTDYTIVAHDKLQDYYWGPNKQYSNGFYCTQIAGQLVFNHIFSTGDSQFGGNIMVPVYTFPDAIDNTAPDTDEVEVDDPDWLSTRCAAEFVRNDIVRRQRYPELLAEANDIMQRMKDDNEGQITEIDKPWTPFSGLHDDSGFGDYA